MPVATRVGVNLSEEAVGTTAPGIVVRTGQPVCVLGSEHFFDHVRQMHCAAAPIHDAKGCLAGVLDLSSESIEFGFDAAAMVGYLASTIENRMLVAQSGEHVILRIQLAPPLLESSTVGLVGIRQDGMVAWVNGVASRLLGLAGADRGQALGSAEAVLGCGLSHLASMSRHGAALLSLPSGLALWARADLTPKVHTFVSTQAADSRTATGSATTSLAASHTAIEITAVAASVQADPPPAEREVTSELAASQATQQQTVKTSHQELLQRALQESAGNLSQAARKLGVSRGWIYRRLQDTAHGG